jgi:hypothetical protein
MQDPQQAPIIAYGQLFPARPVIGAEIPHCKVQLRSLIARMGCSSRSIPGSCVTRKGGKGGEGIPV